MNDLEEIFPVFMLVLCILGIASGIGLFYMKNADNKKPLIEKNGTVIQKDGDGMFALSYTIEFDDGERIRLMDMEPSKRIITVGDYGQFRYRGKSLVAFKRVAK